MANPFFIQVNGTSGNDSTINSDLAAVGVQIKNALLAKGHTITSGSCQFETLSGDLVPVAVNFDIPTSTVTTVPSQLAASAVLPPGANGEGGNSFTYNP